MDQQQQQQQQQQQPLMAASQQQQHRQQQYITHEDYDWMGVLDTLEVEPNSIGHNSGSNHPPVQNPLLNNNSTAAAAANGTASIHEMGSAVLAAAARVAAATAAASAIDHSLGTSSQQQQPGGQQVGSSGVSKAPVFNAISSPPSSAPVSGSGNAPALPTLPSSRTAAAAAPKSPQEASDPASDSGGKDGEDTKKQSRIERKRSREKQRRLDTNSQFTSLAEIVREIETIDLVEEARYNLSKQYGTSGSAIGGVGGIGADGLAVTSGAAALAAASSGDMDHDGGDDGDLALPSLREDMDGDMDSNKRLKSEHPLPTAFNPSNRVDLIARTISQLIQFRLIRRRRNEELKLEKRVNCELKKKNEELRRMVAHYKAVGLSGGGKKEQDKVMMMVPMMVPQDAVSQIANGYGGPHQQPHPMMSPHFAPPGTAAAAAPWMQGMQSAVPLPQGVQMAPMVQQQTFQSAMSCPPAMQSFGRTQSAPAAAAPAGMAPQPPGTPVGDGSVSAPSPVGQQMLPPQGVHPGQQTHAMAQQQVAMLYPQVTNGMPTVSYSMQPQHPQTLQQHPQGATTAYQVYQQPGVPQHAAPPPPAPAPGAPSMDDAATAATQQQQQQQPVISMAPLPLPTLSQQHPQPLAEKAPPAAAHQAGGGNLAHCA